MDIKFIKPFIDATGFVLETMAFTRVQPGKPFLKKEKTAKGDVSSVIGLTGEINGSFSISFPEKSILTIYSNMFGEEIKEVGEEICDAAGEIANIISGHARQKLEEIGKSLKAAIPSVVMGKNHIIEHYSNSPSVAVPFKNDSGQFTIEICFEEKLNRS